MDHFDHADLLFVFIEAQGKIWFYEQYMGWIIFYSISNEKEQAI